MSNDKKAKTLELWEGYEVELDEQLLDDFDFQLDLAEAQRTNNMPDFITMIFALVGGDKVYQDTRKHIIDEVGRFSTKAMLEIVERIGEVLPKANNRAQKHSWQTSK